MLSFYLQKTDSFDNLFIYQRAESSIQQRTFVSQQELKNHRFFAGDEDNTAVDHPLRMLALQRRGSNCESLSISCSFLFRFVIEAALDRNVQTPV